MSVQEAAVLPLQRCCSQYAGSTGPRKPTRICVLDGSGRIETQFTIGHTAVEAIRILRATRAGAVKARKAAINQIHSLLFGAPDELRAALTGLDRAALVVRCARLRVDTPRSPIPPPRRRSGCAGLPTASRCSTPSSPKPMNSSPLWSPGPAPATSAILGVGPQGAAQLLTTAGENPSASGPRPRSPGSAAWHLLPPSFGNTTRHRLHRGGDRQANSAIYLIVLCRLRWHPPTRAYMERRTAEGKTKKEIIH